MYFPLVVVLGALSGIAWSQNATSSNPAYTNPILDGVGADPYDGCAKKSRYKIILTAVDGSPVMGGTTI